MRTQLPPTFAFQQFLRLYLGITSRSWSAEQISVQMTIYYIYIYLVGCDIIRIYSEVYSSGGLSYISRNSVIVWPSSYIYTSQIINRPVNQADVKLLSMMLVVGLSWKIFPDRLIVQHVKQQTCFIGLLALLAGESKSKSITRCYIWQLTIVMTYWN